MLLLGLVLLGATGAFTGLLVAYNTAGPEYTVTMFGNTLGTLNTLQAFLAGIALALLFCLSLAMMFGGARMQRRRRSAQRAARREAASAVAQRDELAARLKDDEAFDDSSRTTITTAGSDASPQVTTVPGNGSAPNAPRRRRMPHVFGH
jgi:membrane protein implicated in regulation of membrane protease activity